ncbi:MAG: hypothetical protein M1827_005635 [Pycnora praestabilis]|nr:MAG: hypothetical protein M1827_005635 [Pycnora praestabilis]
MATFLMAPKPRWTKKGEYIPEYNKAYYESRSTTPRLGSASGPSDRNPYGDEGDKAGKAGWDSEDTLVRETNDNGSRASVDTYKSGETLRESEHERSHGTNECSEELPDKRQQPAAWQEEFEVFINLVKIVLAGDHVLSGAFVMAELQNGDEGDGGGEEGQDPDAEDLGD